MPATPPLKSTPCAAIAAALLGALLLIQPAHAQIAVRDEGSEGIVLSNLPEDAPLPVAPASSRPREAAAAKASAVGRRAARYEPMVRAAASAHGLPEALLRAVIEVESGFDERAVSPKGALGLMQLMPQTARSLNVTDWRDPQRNIDAGARYLKDLLARFGNDVPLALAAYNAGPGAVQRSGGIPRYDETRRYVPRVMVRYHHLQSGQAD